MKQTILDRPVADSALDHVVIVLSVLADSAERALEEDGVEATADRPAIAYLTFRERWAYVTEVALAAFYWLLEGEAQVAAWLLELDDNRSDAASIADSVQALLGSMNYLAACASQRSGLSLRVMLGEREISPAVLPHASPDPDEATQIAVASVLRYVAWLRRLAWYERVAPSDRALVLGGPGLGSGAHCWREGR